MQFLYRRQEPSGAVCRGWIICDKCFQDLSRIDQGIGFAVCLAISVIRPQHFRVLVTEYPVYVAGRIETSGNVYVLILIDRIEICSSLKIRHPVVNVLPRDVARSIFNRHGKAMGAIGMFFHHNLVEIQRRRRDPSFRIGLCRCPEDDGRHACLLLLGQGSTLRQQVAVGEQVISPLHRVVLYSCHRAVHLVSLVTAGRKAGRGYGELLASLVIMSFDSRCGSRVIHQVAVCTIVHAQRLGNARECSGG